MSPRVRTAKAARTRPSRLEKIVFEARTLPNGIPVIFDGTLGVRSVTVCVGLAVGSRDERPGELGLAHLLEHLVMSGASWDGPSVSKWADTVGGQTNATTFKDYVVCWARVPSEYAVECAGRLAAAVAHPRWTDELCAGERLVVVQELLSAAADPADVVTEDFYRELFPGHALGRPVGGEVGALPEFTAAQALATHREWLEAAGLTVVIVGPQTMFGALTAALAESPLGTMERDPAPPARRRPVVAPRVPGEVPAVAADAEYVYLAIGGLGAATDDPLWGAFELLTAAIGGTPGSMLYDAVRGERGLSYHFRSVHASYADCGAWRLVAGTTPDTAGQVGKIIRSCLEAVAAGRFEEQVFRAARQQALGAVLLDNEDPVALAYLDTFFAETARTGAPVERASRLIRDATRDDLIAAARRVLETWTCVVAPRAEDPDRRAALVREGLPEELAEMLIEEGRTAVIGDDVVVISPDTEPLTGEHRALVPFGAERIELPALAREIRCRCPEATTAVLRFAGGRSPDAELGLAASLRYLRAGESLAHREPEPGWTVEPMTAEDVPDVRRLLCLALRIGYAGAADERLIEAHVDAVLAAEETKVFVARQDGAFAGHATLVPDTDELTGDEHWELLDMFVLGQWHGGPASGLLTSAFVEHARATGMEVYGHVSGCGEQPDRVHERLVAAGWVPEFSYWLLPLEARDG